MMSLACTYRVIELCVMCLAAAGVVGVATGLVAGWQRFWIGFWIGYCTPCGALLLLWAPLCALIDRIRRRRSRRR